MTRYIVLSLIAAIFAFTVACASSTTPEPTPTELPDPITSKPTATPNKEFEEAVGEMILTPAARSKEQNRPTSIFDPTATLVPTLVMPLPVSATQGVDALIFCVGQTEAYWLENGPPPMTEEMVECLQTYLEDN